MRTHTKRQRHNRPGVQHLWGFDNGHLASVVPDAEDGALWQLTVLDSNGRANSTTPIGAGVVHFMRPIDVRRTLRQIEALP